MKHSTLGAPRKLTDEQVQRLIEWKPLWQVAKECGVTSQTARRIRSGYRHKKASP